MENSKLYHLIRESVDGYLNYLNDGGARLKVETKRSGDDNAGWIYASDLGMCPLQRALKAAGVPPRYPDLLPENKPMGMWRMQVGVRFAEVIQEAVLWAYRADTVSPLRNRPNYNIAAWAEVPLLDDALKIRGRADLVIWAEEQMHVVEIKSRDVDYAAWEVKPSDWYQLMVYKGVVDVESWAYEPVGYAQMHLLTVDWYTMSLYQFHRADNSWWAENQSGDRWDSPVELTLDSFFAEVDRHHSYRRGDTKAVPFTDPVNEEGGWQCYQKTDKAWPRPTKAEPVRTAVIKPRCEYGCFFANTRFRQVQISEGGRVLVPLGQESVNGESSL